MAQENKKGYHDETAREPPKGPLLCADNCEFFRSCDYNGFLLQCYRDMVLKYAKVKASSSTLLVEHNNDNILKLAEVSKLPFQLANQAELEGFPDSSNGESGQEEGQERTKQVSTHCNCCKKFVGLIGFNCRCGKTFCSLHCYSDNHNYPFDYRPTGRPSIEKENLVV